MKCFAQCVGLLLLIELALVGIEVAIGLPTRGCLFSFRAAGTMILPNGLGIVATVCLAFFASFSQSKMQYVVLLCVTAVLVVASGSGTGVVALLALTAMLVMRQLSGSVKLAASVVMLALCATLVVKLPGIVHRPDVYNSIFAEGGRVKAFENVLHASSTTNIMVGRGLGVGTNAAANHTADPQSLLPATLKPGVWGYFYADSTVTVLLLQLGVLGIIVFYGLLFWAFSIDKMARPAYLVIGLTSLTLDITEVFPVNFLLGLLLAHSISVSAASRARAPIP